MTTIRVPVTNRKKQTVGHAVVDECDAWALSSRWHLTKGYVTRSISTSKGTRKEYLHRLVLGLGPEDAWLGDHVDHDPLNNRRSNLRLASQSQNQANRYGCVDSPFPRGVAFDRRRSTFTARCTIEGTTHWLGSWPTAEAAGKAASDFRRQRMPYSPDARGVVPV